MTKNKKNKKKNRSKKYRKWVMAIVTIAGIILFPPIADTIYVHLLQIPGISAVFSEKDVLFVKPIDGDTADFKIKGKLATVRFLLIDTPETVKVNVAVQPFGKQASERTQQLLKQAKEIQLIYEKANAVDKYGRVLAYIFVDGQLLQQLLVEEGLARVAYYQGNEKYLTLLKSKEMIARQQKIGIWSIDGYVSKNGFNQ